MKSATHAAVYLAMLPALIATSSCEEPHVQASGRTLPLEEVLSRSDSIELRTDPNDPLGRAEDATEWQGMLAVADLYANNVKIFSRDGSLAGTLGRAGDGPGEFRGPVGLAALPDGRLAVVDRIARKVVFFSPEGEYAGEFIVPVASIGGIRMGTDLETLLISGRRFEAGVPPDATGDGLHEFSLEGELVASFAPRPAPRSSGEASAMLVKFDTGPNGLLWGLLTEPILYSSQDRSESISILEVPPADWEAHPVDRNDTRALDRWQQQWTATMNIIAWGDSFIVHFMSGNRRLGTDHHSYALVGPDRRYVFFEGNGKERLIAEWSTEIAGVHLAPNGRAYALRYGRNSGND